MAIMHTITMNNNEVTVHIFNYIFICLNFHVFNAGIYSAAHYT